MERNTFNSRPFKYETEMPFGQNLRSLYTKLGDLASLSLFEFDYDEDALAERLINPNPVYDQDGQLFAPIVDALTSSSNDLQDKALEAGLAVAEYIKNQGPNTRKRLTGYLQACFQIDRLKIGLTGPSGSMVPENSILFYARQSLIEDLEPSLSTHKTVSKVAESVSRLYEKEEWFGWFVPKAFTLVEELTLRHNSRAVTDMFASESKESIEQYGGRQTLHNDIKGFVSETMRNRKYGVKAAYIPASIGGSWVYYDGEDFKELYKTQNHSRELMPDAAAVIFYTDKESLENLVPVRKKVDLGNGVIVRIGGAIEEIEPRLRLVLSYQGELFLDVSQFMPLEKELRGNPGLYEAILAEIIANFHDLTVPLDTIDVTKQPNITQLSKKQKENYDPILQLLIPRLKKRYISEVAEDRNGDKNTRMVRLHDVTWFIRTLPHGFKATPEAIARAKEHDIPLAPNETFVRSHKRGKDNEVKGHIVEKR